MIHNVILKIKWRFTLNDWIFDILIYAIHLCINKYIFITNWIYLLCWFWCFGTRKAIEAIKEPRYCRSWCGDWTHNVQIEAISPAASSPARVFHTTQRLSKNRQFQGRDQGNTGKMTTHLEWTSVTLNTCVSFQLRPGSGDIHIWCFDFDALYLWSTANNWEIKKNQSEGVTRL